MNVGKLRHRLQVQQQGQTQDPATGDLITGWQDVKKIWGSIQPLSVRDFIAAGANQSEVSGRIVIRADDAITPAMRLVYIKKSVAYEIVGILPDADTGESYMMLAVKTGVKVVPGG